MARRIAAITISMAILGHAQEAVETLEEMVVEAAAPRPAPAPSLGQSSMQTVRVVPEATLRRNAAASLGETLGWEPGVSSGYFGPGASRPVIRGFEGVRVRTLHNDIGTFDLSDISPDHGVAIEPMLLESAEIHRGPAALLYGNSAIGGAVNSRSKAIARVLPDRPLTGGIESRYETNGSGLVESGLLTFAHESWVLRFTGSLRDAGDIAIPGHARSDDYERLENPRVYDPGAGLTFPVPNPRGVLPNSAHEGSSASVGVSYLPPSAGIEFGGSYSHYANRYGVPYFYPGDATDLFGDHTLDMTLDRIDLESRIRFDGWISKAEGRLAVGTYDHGEYFTGKGKDDGRDFLDTRLCKDSLESRLDLHHREWHGFTGMAGVSLLHEDLSTLRTIFPPPDLQRVNGGFESVGGGVYFLETYQRGDWSARLGHRIETTRVRDLSLESIGYVAQEREVSTSLSASLAWEKTHVGPLDRLKVTGIVSDIERAPTATERYAFWNNAGIGRFLVGGDLDGTPLSLEQSLGQEIAIEAARGPLIARLNAYHYDFENYIFLQEDPALTGGFGRAVQYIERAARISGFEAELEWKLNDAFTLTTMSDAVHAHNVTDDQPIPRMPPWRFGTRLEWSHQDWTAGMEIRHATEQDRVKPHPRGELTTDAYTMVNLDVSRTIQAAPCQVTFFLRATNLLNEEARLSTSFRKDVAPLPGRGLALGLRCDF